MTSAPYQAAPGSRDLYRISAWLLGEESWSTDAHGEMDERARRVLRLALCCLVLAALPFLTRPGSIIADTKIDLAVNPAGFLDRALHVWDPAQFGQLQDQAYGYFFPVGPFFVAGKLMDLPPWVVQRLWIAALLIAAFLGIVRLCKRLSIGTPGSRITAGFAYALSAPALSELGVLSSEWLPAAMAPWILLPVVRLVQEWPQLRRRDRLKAAAQSAAAVALCSGINAAATLAVLVPAGIYLLVSPRPCPRWRIMCYWVPVVILACSWWIYPLLLLDKYGVSVLPYTESAEVTTSVTSLSNALRGTENWVSYLVVDGQPWWPVAYRVATGTLATLLTGLIAGLGITGLLSRRMPHRRFLLLILLAGVFIILSGYISGLGNPIAAHLDHAINGPLSPFRNVRKFDPLIRFPLALGLANLGAAVRLPRQRKVLALVASVAIAALAIPAYTGGITTAGAFTTYPGYWANAADWLSQHAGRQGVLEVPGARFGQYTWGSPMDDIMEPLASVDWASSQLSAIGSVGNTRLLETIDQQLAAGTGSAGLTQLLARMGVKYVLVRNDLLRSDLRGAWPARIHQALGASPGIVKVKQFGKLPIGSQNPNNAVTDFNTLYPPVEIYQVMSAQPVATVQPTSSTLRVYGAPESLLTLGSQGLLGGRPVLLNSASPQIRASATVVTDSLRRRTRNFGEIRDDYSQTLTANDPATTFEAADDFTEPSWQPYLATARYYGIADITASSSDADFDAIPAQSNTGALPYAAIDGNLSTEWESGSLGGPVGQWIKISFNKARNPGSIQVAFADNRAIGPQVTQVEVSTSAGRVTDPVQVTGAFQPLRLPPGASRWLQITVTAVFEPPDPDIGRQVGISEISIPGITARRAISAPDVRLPADADPTAIVMSKSEPQPSGCMPTSARWVCNPALIKPTEEQYGFDHTVTVAQPAAVSLSGTAVMTSPQLAERYGFPASGTSQAVVTGSSIYTGDPEDLPSSAFDGDSQTTWVANPADPHPTLTIRWKRAVTLSSVKILRPPGVSGPLQVRLTGSGGQTRTGLLSSTGTFRIQPIRTTSLTFVFTQFQAPLQITDVQIPGVPTLGVNPDWPFTLGCGLGPQIELNGVHVPTRLSGTFGDVLTGRPLTFSACSQTSLAAGSNEVIEPISDGFSVQAVTLDASGVLGSAGSLSTTALGAPAAQSEPVSTGVWTDSLRELRVSAASQSYLEVDQNFNSGWQATFDGKVLQPAELDGWRQAWLLPAGTNGVVTLRYLPQASYETALLAGLGAALLVIVLALIPWRRRPRGGTGQHGPQPPSPRQPDPPPPGHQRAARSSFGLLLLVGVAGMPVFGLWVGGELGAILLPLTMVIFVPALAMRGRSRLAAVIAHPAVAVAFLLTAAAAEAVGTNLGGSSGAGGGVINSTTNTIPELLCLIIVGRVAAALALPEGGLRGRGPRKAVAVAGAGPDPRRHGLQDGPDIERPGDDGPGGYPRGGHGPGGYGPGGHGSGGYGSGGYEPGGYGSTGYGPGGHGTGAHRPGGYRPGGYSPGGDRPGPGGYPDDATIPGIRAPESPRPGRPRLPGASGPAPEDPSSWGRPPGDDPPRPRY